MPEPTSVNGTPQTPIAEGIGIGRNETRFSGKIQKVTVEVKDVE